MVTVRQQLAEFLFTLPAVSGTSFVPTLRQQLGNRIEVHASKHHIQPRVVAAARYLWHLSLSKDGSGVINRRELTVYIRFVVGRPMSRQAVSQAIQTCRILEVRRDGVHIKRAPMIDMSTEDVRRLLRFAERSHGREQAADLKKWIVSNLSQETRYPS